MSEVSVVIPAYNAAATLPTTLCSVQAQTLRDIEILVVDDGSTDETAEIAEAAAALDTRVRVIRQENAGVAGARNAGVAVSTARWIAPLDADDLWHPEKLERQLRAAREAPWSPTFVYSWSRRIDANDRVMRDLGQPRHRGDVLLQIIASNFCHNMSAQIIDRSCLEAVGGFDSGLQATGAHGAEDIQMHIALAEMGPVEVAPGYLIGYRFLQGSMSSAAVRMRRSLELVLLGVEQRRSDVPPRLMRLARMNYDFYAASLSLVARDSPAFAYYIASGLRRAPGVGAKFLVRSVVDRVMLSAAKGARAPRFQDVAPDRSICDATDDWLEGLKAEAARRAAAGSALARPRWPAT